MPYFFPRPYCPRPSKSFLSGTGGDDEDALGKDDAFGLLARCVLSPSFEVHVGFGAEASRSTQCILRSLVLGTACMICLQCA